MTTRLDPTLISQFAVLVEDLNLLATNLPLFYRSLGISTAGSLYAKSTVGINNFLLQLKTIARILNAIGAKPSFPSQFVSRSDWSDKFLNVLSRTGALALSLGVKPADIGKANADITRWYNDNIAPWIGTKK